MSPRVAALALKYPAMSLRALLVASLTLSTAAAVAAPAPRYLPAPEGKFYYLLYGNVSALGKGTSSEMAAHPTFYSIDPITKAQVPVEREYSSEWTYSSGEIGPTLGYGLGSLWFIRSLDFSAYLPFTFRSFALTSYFADKTLLDPWDRLHPSLKNGQSGKGLGDLTLSTIMLFYANPSAGTWLSSAVRVTLPTGTSAQGQFTRILHGQETEPGGGGGTTRITPVLSVVKMLGSQRLTLSGEYGIPLSGEAVAFQSGDVKYQGTLTSDANRSFREVFTFGGVAAGTIGLETSLNLWGLVPGLECNVRSTQPATWKEGVDGATPTDATAPVVAYKFGDQITTPAFLQSAAWSIAGLPLKANTEIEVGLSLSHRFGPGDQLKLGVTYITGGFGQSIGIKAAFVSLFLAKPESDRAVPGHAEAREVNVAPLLEAPLAPSSRIATAVTFPQAGAGVSQEEASWTAGQLRAGVRKLRGYDLFAEKDMEQLATAPCGNAECGTRYGRALRQVAVVVSRLEKSGAGFALGIQMINVADGTVAASDSVTASSLENLKSQIPAMLGRLVAPPPAPTPAGK